MECTWTEAGRTAATWRVGRPWMEEVAGVRCPLPWNLGRTALRRSLEPLLPLGPGEANSHCLPHERGGPAWWRRHRRHPQETSRAKAESVPAPRLVSRLGKAGAAAGCLGSFTCRMEAAMSMVGVR